MKSLQEFKHFEVKELVIIKGGDNGLTGLLGSVLANVQVHAGGGQGPNPLAAAASLSGPEVIFSTGGGPQANAHELTHVVQVKQGAANL